MNFIHIADVHLGAQPDAAMPWGRKRADEIWDTFYALLDLAAETETDLLLISGDLFHRQPLKRELKEINYRFSKLAGTQVVIIAGNHDPITEDSNYKDFEWAPNVAFFRKNHLSYIYFEQLGTIVYGMSYDRKEITEPVYDSVKPMRRFKDGSRIPEGTIHILLAHGGDANHIPINMDRLRRAGFDYVALGHIHKPDVHPKAAIAYAGALEPIDRGDEGEHGYILGEIGEARTSVNFIPFACREYRKLKVPMTAEMTGNELAETVRYAIEENGEHHIYKLIIEGTHSADLDLDPAALARLGNIISVTDHSVPDYDYDRILMENKDNIIGMYIEKIRAMNIDEALKARALYQGMRAFAHAQEEGAG